MSRAAKERLLQAAARLFYARGIGATGIDTITAEAGVAKMSLYNNFSSKDDLIQAYLVQREQEWMGLYEARVAQAESPMQRVLAVFDAYLDHAETAYRHSFRGCGLLNAAAELASDSPGRQRVRKHKEHVEALLRQHLREVAPDSQMWAEHFAFLLEGAVSRAGLEASPERLVRARKLASDMMGQLSSPSE